MLPTSSTRATCAWIASTSAARSSWPVTARDSAWSTDSSSTWRRFSSNRRAFSIATPAWLAIASMSATSPSANSRSCSRQMRPKPPITRSLTTIGTKSWLRCGITSRMIAGPRGSASTCEDATGRRVRAASA